MKINGREMSQNTLEYVINFYKRIHPTATLQNVSRFPFFTWLPQLNYMICVNKQVERGRERKSPGVWPFRGSYLTPLSRHTRLAGTDKSYKYLFVYGRICLHNNNKFFDIVLVVYFFSKNEWVGFFLLSKLTSLFMWKFVAFSCQHKWVPFYVYVVSLYTR